MSADQEIGAMVMDGAVADLNQSDARNLVDQINEQFGRAVEKAAELQREQESFDALVSIAYNGRAWLALGYPTWEAMCKVEFTAARVIESIGERREHVQALIVEGLSTRAIGAVLSIDQRTVRRDLVAGAAHAAAAKPNVPVRGIDGKAYQRPTPADQVDRVLKVAQLRAGGHTQQEIGDQFGVSQRTISTYERKLGEWQESLSGEDRQRLVQGEMPRSELASKAGLELVTATTSSLPRTAQAAVRSLTEAAFFIRDDVIGSDEWSEQREVCSQSLAAGLVTVIELLSKWAAEEVAWGAVDFPTRHAATDPLQRSASLLDSAYYEARPDEGPQAVGV